MKSQKIAQQFSERFWKVLREPACAAAITLGVILLALVTIPSVRLKVADNLMAAEVFLYGYDDDDAPTSGTPRPRRVGEESKSNTFKKIVTAPVRLVARLFRGKSNNDNKELVKKASEKDAEKFKAAGVNRTRNGVPGEEAALNASTAAASSVEAAATNLFDEAVELHERGRVDGAIEKLVGSLTLNSNYAEAYNLLGVCHDEKGNYRNAQNEYKKAVKVEPSNARFLNNLGYSYYLAGNYGEAVKWYGKGLKLTPNDKRLHNNIGLAYGRKGEFDKARTHFVIAVGETGANLNLGYVYSQHGKYDDAIKNYEAALHAQPSSLPALSNLAQLYERAGRMREAASLNEQYKKLAVSSQHKEQTVDQ